MNKKNFKKSNARVGKENRINIHIVEDAELVVGKGEMFGDSIVSLFGVFCNNYKGFGAAAIGMAKALAALKDAARHFHVDIDSLYDSQLAYYEELFAETPDEEEN
ncbi:MAG: hypothetical protein II866_13260 [Prevotella sp.]|nr:hypothetical protein [Prevotella sp.]